MAFTLKQLEDYAKRADSFKEQSAKTVIKTLRQLIKNYRSEATEIVSDMLVNNSQTLRLAEITQVSRQLEEALKLAGQEKLINEFRDEFDSIKELSDEYFIIGDLASITTLGGLDTSILEDLVNITVSDLELTLSSRLVRPLQNELVRSTIGVATREEVVRDITLLIRNPDLGIFRKDGKEFTDFNIETLISDSQNRFFRLSRANTADQVGGLDWLIYVGPLDSRTRIACQAMLQATPHGHPGLYEKKEVTISNMNKIIKKRFGKVPNYQLLKENPRIAGGGFNCRHEFLEIDKNTAEALEAQT